MALLVNLKPNEFIKITLEDGRIICVKPKGTKLIFEADESIKIERVKLFSENKFMENEHE